MYFQRKAKVEYFQRKGKVEYFQRKAKVLYFQRKAKVEVERVEREHQLPTAVTPDIPGNLVLNTADYN